MASRAEQYIDRNFLANLRNKQGGYIGAEIEMPLINLAKQPVAIDFVVAVAAFLAATFGFEPIETTLEGYPCKTGNAFGDIFSFETTFNTIEFSLRQEVAVTKLAERFYGYLEKLQEFARQNGYLICGRGINPYAEYADPEPLHTPAMLANAAFLKEFTSHGNGQIFHAFCAATQTHLEVAPDRLIPLLNLLNRLTFVDALLFANSLPFAKSLRRQCPGLLAFPDDTLCFRQLCEAPNTRAVDRDYRSWDEVRRHLLGLRLFVVGDGRGGVRAIRPVTLADYFAGAGHPEVDMQFFRPLEPVSLSKYGTIEIRSTCTQPLPAIFTPVAFYTGLAGRVDEALRLVRDFCGNNRITAINSVLRRKAVLGEPIAPPEKLTLFLKELVEIACRGLESRGYGEELLLRRLRDADGKIQCPAKRELSRLQEGVSPEVVIYELSVCPRSFP